MTHKPNILALNGTHQNKDEKNFVETTGSCLRAHLPICFLSPGVRSFCGSQFLGLVVAEALSYGEGKVKV